MPRELLSYLRQASMFQIVAPRPARSSRLSAQRSPTLLQSALTFCTCYYQGILEVESTSDTPSASPASLDISWAEVPDPAIAPPLPPKSASDTPTSTAAPRMIRTMISIDGDIVQQIQADALTLSNFDALLRVHYWLIQQLLHHLRLEIADYIDTGVFIIWLGLLVLGLVQDWTHPLNALWGLLRSVVISVLLAMLWELLRDRWLPRLQRWIVRWLWEQILNPDRPLHRFATWFMGMK